MCGDTPRSSRSIYCQKPACKQRAYRLRHRPQATPDPAVLRKQLQRQRLLVAHTIYECRQLWRAVSWRAPLPRLSPL